MSDTYKTKEEAEKAVEALGESVLDIFCPLNHGECSPRCPCYQFPSYRQQTVYESGKPDLFYVYKACCNNAMFFNTCQARC